MAYVLDSGLAIALNNTPTTATRASGGASGATSVVITTANANIAYDQTITGTGFAANTKVTSVSGTTVNFSPAATGNITGTITFATTWYKLTDHNRQAIEVTSQLIEKEARMANGTMRKFVVAKKDTISTSWEFLPANNTTSVSCDYVAGGFSESTSIIVSNLPTSVRVGQKMSGGGLATDTTITSISGVPDGVGGVQRNLISFTPAMVSGSVSGQYTFFIDDLIVDENTYSGSWLTAFYNKNVGLPIYLKLVASQHDDPTNIGEYPVDSSYKTAKNISKIYNVFITNFSRTVSKRTKVTDYIDMSIEFTEV